jgi:hypothetical protein
VQKLKFLPSTDNKIDTNTHRSLARQLLPLFSRHTTTDTALAQTKTDTQSKETTTTTTTTTQQQQRQQSQQNATDSTGGRAPFLLNS